MRSAFALRIISGKNIFICKSGKSADFPDLLFHEEGVVAVNGICSAAFCESAALRIAFSPFFMGKSATVDRQFSSTTPPVKMGYRNARRRSDIPKFKIIFPLNMARAQAEAISNRPGIKRSRCTSTVQRLLCLWSLIVGMAGAAAVRCCRQPCEKITDPACRRIC